MVCRALVVLLLLVFSALPRFWYASIRRLRARLVLDLPSMRAERVIGVSMMPGQMQVTPMPYGASSSRSASESPTTPNLVVA